MNKHVGWNNSLIKVRMSRSPNESLHGISNDLEVYLV